MFPICVDFFLPDRDGAFEFFDGPLAGCEGGSTVRGADGDYDARFADLEPACAVHDADVSDVELFVRFNAEALHLR